MDAKKIEVEFYQDHKFCLHNAPPYSHGQPATAQNYVNFSVSAVYLWCHRSKLKIMPPAMLHLELLILLFSPLQLCIGFSAIAPTTTFSSYCEEMTSHFWLGPEMLSTIWAYPLSKKTFIRFLTFIAWFVVQAIYLGIQTHLQGIPKWELKDLSLIQGTSEALPKHIKEGYWIKCGLIIVKAFSEINFLVAIVPNVSSCI